RRTAGAGEYLHIRNPLQVAEELEQRIVALGEAARRRVAATVCPTLPLPRMLPLAVVAFVAGIALLATQRYWTVPLVAYGVAALIHNALVRRRFRKRLLAGVAEATEPDLRLIGNDRARAEAARERFMETRNLDFLEEAAVPDGLPLPQGERVLVTVDRVVQAKAKQSRLLKVADGTLLVTTARLLFLADGRTSELELDRVVRVDVADEVRLTVTPSKREAPGIYFTLGHAHELAEVIRLARENL
ncbi:MAG: hypothetical protein WD314_13305, partial [Trueperaceae bacterium]